MTVYPWFAPTQNLLDIPGPLFTCQLFNFKDLPLRKVMDPDGLDQDAISMEELLEQVFSTDEDPLTDLEDSGEETPTKPIEGTGSGSGDKKKK